MLTAAHCLWNEETGRLSTRPELITAVPGVLISDHSRAATVARVWLHPTFATRLSPARQDIALLELSSEWDLSASSGLGRIALASPATCGDCEAAGTAYVVSGYGFTQSTSEGGKNFSDRLLYVEQRNVPRAVCAARLRATVAGDEELTEGAVCAGPGEEGGGKDSCNGDSGGPLAFDRGKSEVPRYMQVGVVSTGTAETDPLCGNPGDYGIYVSLNLNALSNRLTFFSDIGAIQSPVYCGRHERCAVAHSRGRREHDRQ